MKMQGLYTALVTPFHNGAVDYDKLTRLVEMQIAAGVDGISPVGTTGESPTLSFEEHERVIATVVQLVNGRCKVLAGSGANSTAEALHLTRHAKADGAYSQDTDALYIGKKFEIEGETISFDAEDRAQVYQRICEKVQAAFPDYRLQIIMDMDFSGENMEIKETRKNE